MLQLQGLALYIYIYIVDLGVECNFAMVHKKLTSSVTADRAKRCLSTNSVKTSARRFFTSPVSMRPAAYS